MYKKALSILLSGMLSFTFLTGCGNDEAEQVENKEQNKQVEIVEEENKIQDEDLNEEYEQEYSKKYEEKSDVEKAKELMLEVVYSVDEYDNIRWELTADKETNSVILKIDIDSNTVSYAIKTGQWNDLVKTWTETCKTGKLAFENAGLDANFSVWIGDFDLDNYYAAILNGEVFYNVTD